MVSDDPGTPGDGKWEINLAWTGERDLGETTQDAASNHRSAAPKSPAMIVEKGLPDCANACSALSN